MSERKKTSKVTTGHKVALGALSVLGAVAGWNIIGRTESQPQAASAPAGGAQASTATALPAAAAVATPWPAIAPLPVMPRLDARPLPTLVAVEIPDLPAVNPGAPVPVAAAPGLVALPALAPLPAMPEYVAPPPPPPPPPSQVAEAPPPANNGNVGGGS